MNRSFSSQDDAASYLDLQSAMVDSEEREKLMQRMAQQQIELQQLQQRQKALLNAQQQVSQMDFVTTQDLQEKLERLQIVKHRIGTLQNLLDAAEASEQVESSNVRPSPNGAGDTIASKEDFTNASTVVNEQLEDLYCTVTNLLTDIDKMNVLNDLVDQQKSMALEMSTPDASDSPQKTNKPSYHSEKTVSPLPHVKLVKKSEAKMLPHNLSHSSCSPENSLVERHFYSSVKSRAKIVASSESSFDEASAMQKPVSELWEEMRRYQLQLVQLQQRRKELSSFIKATEEDKTNSITDRIQHDNDSHTTDRIQHDNDSQYKQVQSYETSASFERKKETSFTFSKYFQNNTGMSVGNADALTERTNATWGGSTSTSGDESIGSIAQPVSSNFDYSLHTDPNKSDLSQLPDYVEKIVFKLWDDLDMQNNYLQLLLDDQKALSVLLENTLSMQKNNRNTVMYGISPDFLIYQLDNCSAQIMVYRKNIVLLHKELQEVQNQFPNIDISYGRAQSPYKHCLKQEQLVSPFSDLYKFSSQKIPESRRSTPLKYYTTNNGKQEKRLDETNDSFSRVYQAYQRTSPISTVAKYNSKSTQSDPILKQSKVEKDLYVSFTNAPRHQNQHSSALSSNSSSVKQSKEVPTTSSTIQTEVSKPEISDVDSNASGFPLFEALRDTIYSEAATLISQNESRPHFLIELFHELQQLNSDYLRQHCLFVIRDVVSGYIVDTPKGVDGANRKAAARSKTSSKNKSTTTYTDLIHAMKPLYSENTPSESEASSVGENLQLNPPTKSSLLYDFALDISNASNMTTPGGSQELNLSGDNSIQNPFEVDFLGSTVIHLDEALQRVREMERIKQEKLEQDQKSVGVEQKAEKETSKGNLAQLDAQKLDGKIKQIINELIPVIKSKNEVCSEEKIDEISSMVTRLVANERFPSETGDPKTSDEQLREVLTQCLNKFLGYHLSECGEEMILDISEVLFNELAYIFMIEDYAEDDDADSKADDDACSRDQDSQSVTSDANDESLSTMSTSNNDNVDDPASSPTKQEQVSKDEKEPDKGSVVVDLSVSETKPLTSYGSGEDEEGGSGEEYDQYNEADDVATSMQNDQSVPNGEKESSPLRGSSEKENIEL